MFFEGDKNPHVDDAVFDVTPTLKYMAKTRKVLRMNRVFVETKTDLLGDSSNPDCLPSIEATKKAGIPLRYQEETLKAWQEMREERMKALNDYLEKQRVREEKRSQGIEPDSSSDDDNPFAIYKPLTKHKKSKEVENQENGLSEEPAGLMERIEDEFASFDGRLDENLSKVCVGNSGPEAADNIAQDPGPSTSKNSKPWTSPPSEKLDFSNSDSEDVHRPEIPNSKSLHRATIQVAKRTKVRKFGKVVKKKMQKGGTSGPTKAKERHPEISENRDSCKSDANARVNEEKNNDEPNNTLESMATLTINNSTEESNKITDSEVPEPAEKIESAIDKKKEQKQRKREEKMLLLSNKLKKAADERKLENQRPKDTA